MSVNENEDIRVEIQKLLGLIDKDMIKLKSELTSLNIFIDENASLPATVKMVNEKLMIVAKDLGIDLENIGDIANVEDLDQEGNEENSTSTEQSDVEAIVAATEKLTKSIKTIKKR